MKFFFLLIIISLSVSQTKIDEKIEALYQACANNNQRAGLEMLFKDSPLYTKIFGDEATAKNFVQQLSNLNNFYGELTSYEKIREDKVGKVSQYIYFFYHENYISRFNFTFYERDKKEPLLINFNFDDKFLEEF